MKTITEQLADALRALQAQHCTHFEGSRWKDSDDDAQAAADRALAAYDAQRAEPANGKGWTANAGSVWDHSGKWIADTNCEHAARIVQCVNSHDTLVSALRTILADKGSASFNDDLEAYDAAIQTARDALAQAGVTP